jgi:hypothetical protein
MEDIKVGTIYSYQITTLAPINTQMTIYIIGHSKEAVFCCCIVRNMKLN